MRNRLREYLETLTMQTLLEEYCRADDFSSGADDEFRDRMRRRKNTIHAIFHEREQERLRLRAVFSHLIAGKYKVSHRGLVQFPLEEGGAILFEVDETT